MSVNRDSFYLVSHHDTIAYADAAGRRLRHGPYGIAPLNLRVELDGPRARLLAATDAAGPPLQVRYTEPGGEIALEAPGAGFDWAIEWFYDHTVALRAEDGYLGADQTGQLRNAIQHCHQWERFVLARADTLDALPVLQSHDWVSHEDRRILTLAPQPLDFGNAHPAEASALAATFAPGARQHRRELAFGSARLRLSDRTRRVVFEPEGVSGSGDLPDRVRILGQDGAIHSFSRFAPLIVFALPGDDEAFRECLRLALTSLAEHACYDGAVAIACDRPPNEVVPLVPPAFRDRLLLSGFPDDGGPRLVPDYDSWRRFRPILWCDVGGVVFDAPLTEMLIDVLLAERVCRASAAPASQVGEAESAVPAEVALIAAPFGFDRFERVEPAWALAAGLAATGRGRATLADVITRAGFGDRTVLGRFYREISVRVEAPVGNRRGLLRFLAGSGREKAAAVTAYLAALGAAEDASDIRIAELQTDALPPGLMSAVELAQLATLAARVPPAGCIVVVGPVSGSTSLVLSHHARSGTVLYWVSAPLEGHRMEPAEDAVHEAPFPREAGTENPQPAADLIPLRGHSPWAFLGWRRPIDLLLIAGPRTYPGLRFDAHFWTARLRRGGLLCLHPVATQFPDMRNEAEYLAAHRADGVATLTEALCTMRLGPSPVR